MAASSIPSVLRLEGRAGVLPPRGHGLGKPAELSCSKQPTLGMNDKKSVFSREPCSHCWHRQKPAQTGGFLVLTKAS